VQNGVVGGKGRDRRGRPGVARQPPARRGGDGGRDPPARPRPRAPAPAARLGRGRVSPPRAGRRDAAPQSRCLGTAAGRPWHRPGAGSQSARNGWIRPAASPGRGRAGSRGPHGGARIHGAAARRRCCPGTATPGTAAGVRNSARTAAGLGHPGPARRATWRAGRVGGQATGHRSRAHRAGLARIVSGRPAADAGRGGCSAAPGRLSARRAAAGPGIQAAAAPLEPGCTYRPAGRAVRAGPGSRAAPRCPPRGGGSAGVQARVTAIPDVRHRHLAFGACGLGVRGLGASAFGVCCLGAAPDTGILIG
jgi:hypothetical protein